MIIYTPRKKNQKADALTRREQDIGPQDQAKAAYYTKALLQPEDLDPAIQQELLIDVTTIDLYEPIGLVDRLLEANRAAQSLDELRTKAATDSDFQLQDGLLFFQDKLVVPDEGTLHIELIHEAHI